MFKYITAEIYRILHKKSMYIYFGAFAILYIIYVFAESLQRQGLSPGSVLNDASGLFPLLPVVIGGYLFAALYTDDLSSKNLITLIGFGMGKAKVVLSKFLLMMVLGAVIFGLVPLFELGVYAVFGVSASAAIVGAVYVYALSALLTTAAFAALTGVVVYGLQRGTFAMVLYIILAFGIVSQLAALLLGSEIVSVFIPGLESHIMSGITVRIQTGLLISGPVLQVFAEYVIYVAVALALSVWAFNKKELEF